MKNSIHYTSEHPTKFNELLALYESLGWNSLKLTVNELEQNVNKVGMQYMHLKRNN